MYKLRWDTKLNPYKNCFVVGNYESIIELWFLLDKLSRETDDSDTPINLKIYDLSGNVLDTAPHNFPSIKGDGERTR